MTNTLSLNGTWDLAWAEDAPDFVCGTALPGRMTLKAAVPAPIHRVLMDAGLLDDINVGLNTLKARWVEEMFWAYRRTFDAPKEAVEQRAWLVFERLEMNAVVWLNGEEVGRHANAHRPARFDVTGKVRAGENTLVVRVESGLHESLDKPANEYAYDWFARMTKRPWDRKPQYQCGWDWNPRLMNVGILGDARLEWCAGPRLDGVTVFAVPSEDLSRAVYHVRATVDAAEPGEAVLRARIAETGPETAVPLRVEAGESRHEVALTVENPALWWPVGHGKPALYTVEVTLEAGGSAQAVTRRTGVRRVEMDQSPHPDGGRYCTLKINNRPVFCKGGNWVPPDMLYSEVTPERYRELADLALGANFNMLRVWGGGPFAHPALCDVCDEKGLLLWHDFLFACAKYPGDWPEFAAEVRQEVTWAVREMARHPSLVVWCGNNEIEWGDWGWDYDNGYRTHPHYAMFHHDIPKIVFEEDPSTIHWLSSPWSPDFRYPNDPTVGDQHPWDVSIMQAGGADFWRYRACVDRFPNEGGVLGASSPATLRQFLPENERRLLSPSWQHHDNPLAFMDAQPGAPGHAYQTVTLWMGRDPFAMEMEEYAFLSALLHAEGLQEYIANFRRRMFSSASAIFWMYNDSWPATHGWTIVDYYCRKKLSYHPVRRAFQPVTAVVAEEGGTVTVWGVNDTPEPWNGGKLRCGLFALDGGLPVDMTITADLPPLASTPLARFDRADWERLGLGRTGAFAVLSRDGRAVAQHRLFLARFKDLALAPEPRIEMQVENAALTLVSGAFAWGVCLDVDGELPLEDNAFDLLPGIPYTVAWPDALPAPRCAALGNRNLQGGRT